MTRDANLEPTLAAVAARAGVSGSTASLVFSGAGPSRPPRASACSRPPPNSTTPAPTRSPARCAGGAPAWSASSPRTPSPTRSATRSTSPSSTGSARALGDGAVRAAGHPAGRPRRRRLRVRVDGCRDPARMQHRRRRSSVAGAPPSPHPGGRDRGRADARRGRHRARQPRCVAPGAPSSCASSGHRARRRRHPSAGQRAQARSPDDPPRARGHRAFAASERLARRAARCSRMRPGSRRRQHGRGGHDRGSDPARDPATGARPRSSRRAICWPPACSARHASSASAVPEQLSVVGFDGIRLDGIDRALPHDAGAAGGREGAGGRRGRFARRSPGQTPTGARLHIETAHRVDDRHGVVPEYTRFTTS